jgi:hypothetical protein
VVFDNASAVPGLDATSDWTMVKRDTEGNDIDGFDKSYLDRGYRLSSTGIIAILPFGCTSATEAAAAEVLRQKKGAGVLAIVECRQVP